MNVQLRLNYHSVWGETVWVCGNIGAFGENNENKALPLIYMDDNTWAVAIETELDIPILEYYYFVKDTNGVKKYNAFTQEFTLIPTKTNLIFFDTWCNASENYTPFFTKPFAEIFNPNTIDQITGTKKGVSHIFKVQSPVLQPNETICIIGNHPTIGNWDTGKVVLLKSLKKVHFIALQFPETTGDLVYKYGIFNKKTRSFVQYEKGQDRILSFDRKKNTLIQIHDKTVHIDYPLWRGCGVAIPVFSLRSKTSFGVGEFSDIKLLAKWAHKTGLKLIQLLPINDTIVNRTNSDSYPYAANSSFALHPLYINLNEVGKLPANHKLALLFNRKQRSLNKEKELQYEPVIKFKLAYLKAIFEIQKNDAPTEAYLQFFETNKHWLIPYGIYCYLRDKHKTSDFSQWGRYKEIDAEKAAKLMNPSNKHCREITFWFFIQFHLHQQLTNAVAYVHELGIAIKGDIPIGIGRTSCDAWQYPHLFNMEEQAGAPPDDFAVKGQNWGFPTYNWEAMQKEGFKWWKLRFEKMNDYFDAFRIDHILGFFRIWSIPVSQQDGIMGHFLPCIPVHLNELGSIDIIRNKAKYCMPYCTRHYLELLFAGDDLDAILEHFFTKNNQGGYDLKALFTTQNDIAGYFEQQSLFDPAIEKKLKDCITNVIFFEEEHSNGTRFHFNIAMEKSFSYQQLSLGEQSFLKNLYINYFYERQEEFWRIEALKKLPGIQHSTNMLMCGEDLGMVPNCVPGVLKDLSILSLEVQRMPKSTNAEYVDLNQVPYLSVVTPSTHDMSTIRGWWEEDRAQIQKFYNQSLHHFGEAPVYCEPWIAKQILQQHLNSKAMFSIFQLQDILSMQSSIRRTDPNEERINQPANPKHYWCYRMHIRLEELLVAKELNETFSGMIKESGRI